MRRRGFGGDTDILGGSQCLGLDSGLAAKDDERATVLRAAVLERLLDEAECLLALGLGHTVGGVKGEDDDGVVAAPDELRAGEGQDEREDDDGSEAPCDPLAGAAEVGIAHPRRVP